MKITLSLLIAATVTAALLFLMSQLIQDEETKTEVEPNPVELSNVKIPNKKPEPKRSPLKPPKLPVIEKTPSIDGQVIESIDVLTEESFLTTNLVDEVSLDGATTGFGRVDVLQDSSAMAMYRAQPSYPIKAQLNGIEGWVLLKYDVDASGTLSNISVLDSQPKNIFDKEAVKALKEWKFRPAMTEGRPIASLGQTVKIEFNMDNQ
ncbi:TonB family protein [Kangiella sediminilitoris]|uniref:Protein TonB n=1 Tax=Kangiella sediminilitoris TaxID=1144748 RepID=A0A1B3BCL2_9GAMM|nr:TonB family protein [Kangiella sediminilitoris]AOE50551.1 TonB family protein [Kangiella sediminilitoris]